MTTQAVSYTVPSPSWTGSIDVTLCDLDTDLAIRDFTIFYNGTEQGTTELAKWTKVSSTSLSYSGTSILTTNDVVRIQRETPNSVKTTVSPLDTISSSAWNAEFNRIVRKHEEYDLFGTAVGTVSVSDEVYGTGWNGVTTVAPSKNSVYDKIESIVSGALVDNTAYAVSWDGVTTQAPSKNAVYDKIETMISDTAYGVGWNGVANVAPSQNAVYDIMASTITSISDNRQLGTMNARLTVATGNPLVTTNTSSTTLYYTPYLGTTIYLYSGSAWERFTLSQISLALSGLTDDLPYDVFVYNNGGTPTLELTAWTNNTTRATALTLQDGIYVRSGATTRRFVGTLFAVSNTIYQGSASIAANTVMRNSLWNYYNQVVGVHQNTNAVTISAASALTAWYTNVAAVCVKGLPDTYMDTAECSLTINNASGSTQSYQIRVFDAINSNSMALVGGNVTTGSSILLSASSLLTPNITIGRSGIQATYFVSSTSSATASDPRFRRSFVY